MDSESIDKIPTEFFLNNPYLNGVFLQELLPAVPNAYTKKTVLQSPIITKIVPQFVVCVDKPLSGLASSYVSEEKDQTWVPPAQDSFFGDDMSEDDAFLGLGNDVPVVPTLKLEKSEFAEIEILVKNTLLLVDGIEYPFVASVTACAVVPRSETASTNEDSLLVALLSGFQLLIRVWKVPRLFSDALFSLGQNQSSIHETSTSHVYKPFVVQWWQLSGEQDILLACLAIAVHPAGLSAVSAASDSVFRVYTCENTDFGMQLLKHVNVPVNGVVLHTCFAYPFESLGASNHILLMALTFTTQRRLAISLYSWYASEPLQGNVSKTTLPLNNTFPFPVMVVPLAENNSFLFVCPEEFIIVTVNNIWSADYSFSKFAYDGSFPTSYSTAPAQSSLLDRTVATDEVFLASDSGVIYSVIISDNKELTCSPLLRIADPISTFTLNHVSDGEGYILTYASDTAGAKSLYFTSLMAQDATLPATRTDKIPYSEATLLKDYKNWAPVIDVLVVDAPKPRNYVPESAQELWALTGIGKRTKLSHLRTGYIVKRELRTFENLRKAESVNFLSGKDKLFIICSMSFESKILEYAPEIEENDSDEEELGDIDPIIELDKPGLISDSATLCFQFLPNSEIAYHFTPLSITATNMQLSKTSNLPDSEILFAEMARDIAILVVQKNDNVTMEIIKLAEIHDFTLEEDLILNEAHFRVIKSIPINDQISMMKCFDINGTIYIVSGSFLGSLDLLSFNTTTGEYAVLFLIDLHEVSSPSLKDVSFMIPHDSVISPELGKLYVGTKLGHLLEFDLDETFSPKLSQALTLGTTPAKLVLSKTDPHFLFVCMRNLWLFNFYASTKPMRVSFDERMDKAITLIIELPTQELQHLRFGFLREDGLVIGSVFCHEKPILRQLGIGEPAKRLLFLDTSNLFVIMCKSKSQLTRLKFAERKSFKMLPTVEVDSKTGVNRNDWIFAHSEIPTCAMVWHINRNDRVSKKVIVGTLMDGGCGNLKILDISKVMIEGTRVPTVKVVELWSISRDKPVTSIQQIDSTVFFSAGPCVYSTSYSLENKKFRPVVKLATVSSDITNLGIAGDDILLVNTLLDSVLAFKYTEGSEDDNMLESTEGSTDVLNVTFKDTVPRCLVNATSIGTKFAAGDKLFSTLRVFDPEKPPPGNCFSFSLSMVPRVYTTNFSAYWSNYSTGDNQICCVAVNGQTVVISPVNDQGDEVTSLKQKLALEHKLEESSSLDVVMERLDRPFLEKVTGKGFQSIYKPFFDYGGNMGKVIDYDVEELSKMSWSGILL